MRNRLIFIAFLSVVAQSLRGEAFDDARCGVSFHYPAAWSAELIPARTAYPGSELPARTIVCAVGLRPAGWNAEREKSELKLSECAITILIVRAPFLTVARVAGFMRVSDFLEDPENVPGSLTGLRPDDWTIAVRQGVEPATQFTTACCQAVRGETWGHTEAKDGSKATFTSEVAVLNDRDGHTAVFGTDDAERFRSVLTGLISSFRLRAPVRASSRAIDAEASPASSSRP